MKVYRKGLGLILGGLMAISMIGCSNKIEQAEELLKENIQNEIERNLEEYEPQYNELNNKERLYLNSTKDIDMDKIDVEIKELDDSYEATVTLGYKDEDIENVNDIFVLEIAKDKLTEEDLKNEDFLHETTYLETVVAHSTTYKGINGELITWLYCEKGYAGHTKNEYGYENKNKTVLICDNWELEKDFLLCLGDLMFNI
jgi:hypothetical protein